MIKFKKKCCQNKNVRQINAKINIPHITNKNYIKMYQQNYKTLKGSTEQNIFDFELHKDFLGHKKYKSKKLINCIFLILKFSALQRAQLRK